MYLFRGLLVEGKIFGRINGDIVLFFEWCVVWLVGILYVEEQ